MIESLVSFLPLMVTASAGVICFALLLSMGRQSRKFSAEYLALQDCVAGKLTELDTALKTIHRPVPSVVVAEEPQATLAGLAKTGLNSTNRSKVLKMHRLGHSPEQIAASLRLPRGEVFLLVKIHEIAMKSFEPATPALSMEKS